MLQVGFARVDATPPLGTGLAGYFKLRESDGVLDPIELNALAISNDTDTLLIITGDFMMMTVKACDTYRAMLEKETGVPADHILLQAIHQHTSIHVGAEYLQDQAYLDILARKYRDVAKMALNDRKEARIFIGEQETAKTLSFIRRFRMKDGTTRTNPGFKNADKILHPLGKADNTVRLVKFEREGAKDIAFVNFGTHPDVIGGEKFSADWPGFVRRLTEKAFKNVHCILMNGCQGDTNHIDPFIERDMSPEGRYAHSQMMGRVITDTVMDLWNRVQEVPAGKIFGKIETVRIPTNTSGIERVEECKAIQEAYWNGTLNRKLEMAEHGEIRRIANMENVTLFQQVPLTVLGFGKIAIVGYAGEPFTEYADILRAAYPELFVLSACLANGGQGYLPSRSAFEEGGYEARTTNFTETVAESLQSKAKEFLAKI